MEEMCGQCIWERAGACDLWMWYSPQISVFTNLEALQTLSFGLYRSFIPQAQMAQSLTTADGSSPSPFWGSQEGDSEGSSPVITWLALYACQSLSHVRLFVTPWTQAPLSVGFPRQEYWSGQPFPSPGHLPNQGSSLHHLHCRQILYRLSYQDSPVGPLLLCKNCHKLRS